jgi:type IV pilus assembly protein PilZ
MDGLGSGVRNGILNLTITTVSELYASYMPFVINGGIFIPTRHSYMLGDEVFLLLNLLDEPDKIPVTGKVVWLSPKGLTGNRKPGIGIQLSEANHELIGKIEAYLAGLLEGTRPTYTM